MHFLQQCLFCRNGCLEVRENLFLFGDIFQQSPDPIEIAQRVLQGKSSGLEPANAAILSKNSKLLGQRLADRRLIDLLVESLTIRWMDQLAPPILTRERSRVVACDRLERRVH